MNANDQFLFSQRLISLGEGLAKVPESLLLAHAKGEVLFVVGAGVSRSSNLPDFRSLTLKVYEELDSTVYNILKDIPVGSCNKWLCNLDNLNPLQSAEVRRYINGEYDVALGMLERRMDLYKSDGKVRQIISKKLRGKSSSSLHRTLMSLSDKGGVRSIITTNFDLLLQEAISPRPKTFSLDSIPRPSKNKDFCGVFHIHGALDIKDDKYTDLVLSDQDFGEYYLRRRAVPDFIYDAARLYNLVLVGYSANDPPMRYLLNAITADGRRFNDLKERYTFISNGDPVNLADWRARGITPIHYDHTPNHDILIKTLSKWDNLFSASAKQKIIDSEIRKIVSIPRVTSSQEQQDLFDHIVRRSNSNDRIRISSLISSLKATHDWFDALHTVAMESSVNERA